MLTTNMPEETTEPEDPMVGALMRQFPGLDHLMASTLVVSYQNSTLDVDRLQLKCNGNDQPPTPPQFTCEVTNPD